MQGQKVRICWGFVVFLADKKKLKLFALCAVHMYYGGVEREPDNNGGKNEIDRIVLQGTGWSIRRNAD